MVNAEPGVAPDKVDAVRRAVVDLDYRPNVTASSLRRLDGRTAAIAALLEDLANPYSAEVHRALADVAQARDSLIFAGSVDEDVARERSLVRAFVSRRADGLVLAPASRDQSYLHGEVPESMPVVFIDRPPVGYEADAVVTDNTLGARTAVAHLAGHGHRWIAFLGDRRQIVTARERHEGYLEALAAAGLPLRPELVVHDLHTIDRAAAAIDGLLDGPHPPTAVFSAQNNVTAGVLRVLRERGLQHQVAVVGFDDFPLAELLQPGVTVVGQDPATIGRAAGELLFARLEGDDSPRRTVVVASRLVARGSGELAPS